MKRLIALLALLPLLAMGGGKTVMTGNHRHVFAASGGGIAYVGSNCASSSGSVSSLTVNYTPTVGHTLVVGEWFYGTPLTPPTKDNLSNSLTALANNYPDANPLMHGSSAWIFGDLASASGVTSFTVTPPSSDYIAACVVEYSGVVSFASMVPGNASSGVSSLMSLTLAATTKPNDWYVTSFQTYGISPTTTTPIVGHVRATQNLSGYSEGLDMMDNSAASLGSSITNSATIAAGSGNWIGAGIELKSQ